MMGLQSKLKDKNSSTKEYKGGLYCLNPDLTSKGKEKLVCLFGKSSCLLANGSIPKLESRAVTRQLISRQVCPPRKSFLYALLHEGKDESFQFTAELSRNQGISVNMTLYKAMVSQIIPTKDDEKKKSKKKAQKANIESKTRDKLFKRYQ